MIEIRPFLAGDVVQMDRYLRADQRVELGLDQPMDMAYGRDLAANGKAWTAHDGRRLLCCAGFRETFAPVQAVAWAMFARDLPPGAGVVITRFARRTLAALDYRRIEAIVDCANEPAVRWAEAIGLTLNTYLLNFGADSRPHLLFERINGA